MKKNFLFFIALAAGIAMAASCSKSEEDSAAASGTIDYIEFKRYDEGEDAGAHSKIVYTPTFDAEGKLLISREEWYFADHETGELAANQYYITEFTYNESDHSIDFKRGNGYWDNSLSTPAWSAPTYTETATLPCDSDWNIKAWKERNAVLEYEDGYLTDYDDEAGSDYWWTHTSYVWENGDLVTMHVENISNDTEYDMEFTYTDIANPFGRYDIFSSQLCGWIDGESGQWAAGLFGKHSKHLLSEEKGEDPIKYSYKKDSAGRIIEVRRQEGESVGGSNGGVFEIHWK